MSRSRATVFMRAFKLSVLNRMAAGENVSALARELKLRRKLLFQWRDRLRHGGPAALRTRKAVLEAEAAGVPAGEGAAR